MLRSLVLLAAAVFLPLAAVAQQPAPADPVQTAAPATPPPAAEPSACADLTRDRPATKDYLDFVKACQETFRLQAEIESIKASTANSMFASLVALGPLFGALVALISAGIGYSMKSGTEKRLMIAQQEHARAVRREDRTMRMLGELSGNEAPRQSFAAAGLLSLVREVMEDSRMPAGERNREASMLVTAMLARLRDPDLRPAEVKYIADGLHKIFTGDKKKPAPFKTSDFNFQQVRLAKAYLADLDAKYADFFEADLSEVSLRRAQLQNATFRNANLRSSVLAEADLEGADLRGAHLEGARLDEARNLDKARFNAETTWDKSTTWPTGFNPASAGLGSASA
jgi:pentapeptide repeat protein